MGRRESLEKKKNFFEEETENCRSNFGFIYRVQKDRRKQRRSNRVNKQIRKKLREKIKTK